ncbi:hypothetical protein AMS68_002710 [Peltaster fructicola]|uniref:Phosphoglycerate mutase (2,3-diphosphoglycerate-dependent) n=1 Tax=Peltaster fructicola TaxID=286661 RepID=A0A6H0XR63_9PEZI|nr:hypothetical protein AMS68_002710 [Peltaster fructicola]
MKLFLIRHGETVDNIAGIYAGVKDSQLTNFGVEQTKKLGSHFATTDVVFTHIFASPLIRAYRTAEAIRDAQQRKSNDAQPLPALEIIKVPDLIEQDFGYYEGKPFHARSSPNKAGRVSHAEIHKNDPSFVDVETKEAMSKRADNFLDSYLLPIVDSGIEPIIAVVSHGMLLSTLWRRILLRIPRKALSIAPEVITARGPIVLEHLGGWSNTGCLRLHFTKQESTEQVATDDVKAITTAPVRKDFTGFTVLIVAIDSKAHLTGLKRQRGGIGSLGNDESQQKLTSFFKKPRTG